MNIILQLLLSFFTKHKYTTAGLIITSLTNNILLSYGISRITALIIQSVQEANKPSSYFFFKLFVGLSFLYIVIHGVYRLLQSRIISNLRQWVRREVLSIIMAANNESYSDVNYTNLSAPINKLSTTVFYGISNFITYMLPNFLFLMFIGVFFVYQDLNIGLGFNLANLLILGFIYFTYGYIKSRNDVYEANVVNVESKMQELLVNFDKVIYRAQSSPELSKFDKVIDTCIESAIRFYNMSYAYSISSSSLVLTTVCVMNYLFLGKATRNEISPVQFITFFSMLIVYRDKMTGFIQEIPDMIEMFGRGETVLDKLDEMGINNISLEKKQYQDPELEFGIITYKDVTFKYDGSDRNVLTNFNQEITTNNKIIGIVGHSGNGKSTIMKLLLRLYKPNSGTIMIDGHDITTISPEYIRSNVTFINQNSRLFDTKVIDNMMYGCKQEDDCKRNLKNVMEYEKIKELYKRINIYDDSAGTMGENLSGGQRQIVNVISGLINPSPILVLDEPTNALDPGLKRELMNVIQDFRKFKKSIIIITHDKEVQSLFDTTVQM